MMLDAIMDDIVSESRAVTPAELRRTLDRLGPLLCREHPQGRNGEVMRCAQCGIVYGFVDVPGGEA